MANKIGYIDCTWNPVSGCTPISEGCANCYAARMAKRLAGRYGYPKDDPFKVTFHADKLREPLHWGKPQKVFVCSMGDLFHENVGLAETNLIFTIISLFPQHTFMLLTKRPEIVRQRLTVMHTNIWLGVTAENQRTADERIPILLQIPAAKRFVSVEPMLGPVNLTHIKTGVPPGEYINALTGARYWHDYQTHTLNKLDWVIAGPETGPKARPCDKAWVADLYKQCNEVGVPFWDKTDILGKNIKERPNG